MKIAVIGAGNVATHLALNLNIQNDVEIIQIISKTNESAQILAKKINCSYSNDFNKIKKADLYIISTNDDSIEYVATNEKLKNKFLVHTSGSTEMKILSKYSDKFGVFYPMQTFKKDVNVDFKEIPLFIEASNFELLEDLEFLAKKISNNVHKIDSNQRMNLHIAAVFINNFTNHLFYIAEEILKVNSLESNVLKPLIDETLKKLKSNKPLQNQTGPARRKDFKIIEKHLKNLSDIKPDFTEIYKAISESISRVY